MKKRNIFWACLLIFWAVFLILDRLPIGNVLPVSLGKILLSAVFAYFSVMGFAKKHFIQGFLSLAFIFWTYSHLLHIEALVPWTLIVSALLLGIAFNLLFGKRFVHINYNSTTNTNHGVIDDTSWSDGQIISIDNTFHSTSRYINAGNLQKATIDNAFGECMVYFTNCTLSEGAFCSVDNAFGQTKLFIPNTWSITVRQDCVFGNVSYQGLANTDPNAPHLNLDLDSAFGDIKLTFI